MAFVLFFSGGVSRSVPQSGCVAQIKEYKEVPGKGNIFSNSQSILMAMLVSFEKNCCVTTGKATSWLAENILHCSYCDYSILIGWKIEGHGKDKGLGR